MDIRSTIAMCMVMMGLSSVTAPVWADEIVAPKSESTPTPVPAPATPPVSVPNPVLPKSHAQDAETKPPVKTQASGAPAETPNKESVPGKTESTPTPSKPKVQEGESKPPAKAPHLANGSALPKPTAPLPPEIAGKDGAAMVLVTASEFTMGSDKGDDDESPVHRVYVDTFYLDKFEVTNGRFAKFVEAIQSEPPWGFSDKDTPVTHADRPVRWVSWMDAMGYCLWAGKRLPTEAEWEKAARGTDGRVYPWGNEVPTAAHAVFGLKEGGGETVSPIGNRDKGKSAYGAHDLAGNLYEWVMDWYAEDFYANFAKNPAINPRGPIEGTAKVQRGGSYINNPYRLRSSFRTKGDPTEQDPNVGFRCAQEVPKLP
ncbi:SUMF1/EgtB/PvdO family nonheme iron enzyme [Nitrospira lenta]|uniref:Sulfatase-modifying factor enzyme-like domain-containing protein n=1 Tax=Nitrospira lenta TaxID=1436998 RepID=A0A330L3V1_9BACT|nr:SUMF1/EgtB/PvdO family nonheme iron enzyme [Nitrospira lenta]SPP64494.1 conserved exported hypothetical protein [Nitrospira lenta]